MRRSGASRSGPRRSGACGATLLACWWCCVPYWVLLDGHRGAGALQGGLGLVCGFLVDVLQNDLGSAVDQVLGLLQPEAGEGADLLDDLDLLVAGGLEGDVELVLLLGSLGRGAGAPGTRGGHGRDRSGRLDVERVLKLLHELGQLEEGHLLERVHQVVSAELRPDLPSCSLPYVWLGAGWWSGAD